MVVVVEVADTVPVDPQQGSTSAVPNKSIFDNEFPTPPSANKTYCEVPTFTVVPEGINLVKWVVTDLTEQVGKYCSSGTSCPKVIMVAIKKIAKIAIFFIIISV